MIRVDLSYLGKYKEKVGNRYLKGIKTAHETLETKSGKGKDFLGWLDLAQSMKQQVSRINAVANTLKEKSQVLLVIGIGGSYLGAKAAYEALSPHFKSSLETEIIFAGHQISGEYMLDLKEYLKDKDFSINVISKSGTTTEPALAFRFFKSLLEERYGEASSKKRIVATTDKSKGALRNLANQEGYETFVIEDDVGGRYSVLSPVGLLPIAVSGINIDEMLDGAIKAQSLYSERSMDNPVYQYVAARNLLYETGKNVELFVAYEPKLSYVAEWWKQLFGESEGKENKGIFPASASFTTDLHSLGQYIQEGERQLFETVVSIKKPKKDLHIPKTDDDLDGLNYLSDMSVDQINKQAMQGTLLAHMDGDAPSILIEVDEMSAFSFGMLVYYFELSCALSGYLLDVNPFNQPGVEAYKKNMFALLEKPGFEAESKAIRERLSNKKTR